MSLDEVVFRMTIRRVFMRPLITLAWLYCLSTPAFAQVNGTVAMPRGPEATQSSHPATLELPSAQTPPHGSGPLLSAAIHESSCLAARSALSVQQPATRSSKPRSWISQHPALFGALVGAGAGALASGTMENELFCSGGDEDCFFHGGSRLLVGAGMGASIGVLIGWLGSL